MGTPPVRGRWSFLQAGEVPEPGKPQLALVGTCVHMGSEPSSAPLGGQEPPQPVPGMWNLPDQLLFTGLCWESGPLRPWLGWGGLVGISPHTWVGEGMGCS